MATPSKCFVITGVTRGLGRALAEGLMQLGHTVLGCGRSERVIAELQQAMPAPHDFAVVDVASAEQVDRWAQRLLSKHEAPDFLINNAALINRNAPLWKVPAEEFSQVIDVNIKGVVNTIRAFVPAMIEKKSGVIVNFTSYWGRSTAAEVAPYCATKWAMEGLTRALAKELPSGLAAVALNPGVIDTDMLRSCFGEGAGSHPNARQWGKQAVPFVLQLSAKDNGQTVVVPGY